MFEHLFRELPESAQVCRQLYDPKSGGYRIPPRADNRLLTLDDLSRARLGKGISRRRRPLPPVVTIIFSRQKT